MRNQKGGNFPGVRKKIGDLDQVSALELGKGYQTPESLRVRLLGKSDVLQEDGQCLSDIELVKAFRASNVVKTYRFKGKIRRRTATIESPAHLERGLEGQKRHGNSPAYMRTIDRQLQNELSGDNSRCGVADTYYHTRRIPQPGRDNDRRRRNDPYRTSPRNNRHNQRRDNCSVGDEVGDGEDNEDYFDGDRDSSDYQRDRPQNKVNFAENDNNYSPCELELGDIEGRRSDSEVEGYLANRSAAKDTSTRNERAISMF